VVFGLCYDNDFGCPNQWFWELVDYY
jgi:hypothetical protein